MLIVSHDRDLLNTAAEFILHLEHGKLTLYTGGYDKFVEARAQKRALDAAFAKKQEAPAQAHAGLRRPLQRQGVARRARRKAASRCWQRLQTVDVPVDEHAAPIRLPEATPASPPLDHHGPRLGRL